MIKNLNTKQYHEELIKSIVENIQIKSVEETPEEGMPYGRGPAMALKNVLDLSERLGFRVVNMENHVGYAEIGEGEEMIGILGHVDVVPEADGWELPPFSGAIKDGYMYGRGTSDDKGPIITALYSVKALMDAGVKFNKRVRIIFGANEESGFGCMKHYVANAELPTIGFTPDARFPGIHGEKGILQLLLSADNVVENGEYKLESLKGGLARNSVADKATAIISGENLEVVAEKMVSFLKTAGISVEFKIENGKLVIETHGKSAHAMSPDKGINAISHMMAALEYVNISQELVSLYNSHIGLKTDGSKFGCAISDSYGALTMNIGIIDYENGRAEITIDIRYPISKKIDEVMTGMNSTLVDNKFALSLLAHKEPIYFEIDAPLIQALRSSYQEITGDMETMPTTTGGGTYARAMKNVVAFGGGFPGEQNNEHQPNEKVKVENFYKQLDIYALAVMKLLEL